MAFYYSVVAVFCVATIFLPTPINGGFGSSTYNSGAGDRALGELRGNENIATYSAQSAVASAVGRDYANQLSTTSQFASQFTAPVTKQQASEAFNAVRHQQQGSLISAALANAAPAINRAGEGAARDNFNQAYAKAEGDRLHGTFHDRQQQEMVYLAGSALAAQQQQAQQAAHYRDAAKTSQTRTSAAAIQAIHGIQERDRNAGGYGG
ncbi:uncharacterized protein LOC110859806 [Folsomia candida]|uniref:uncharacterized protein LOC110859806 n=1 Tax=Folsomia candida TaxID=158441 RepID=UPI000B8FD868|nr:uncharacterized protein LOC110859806 [Folsomia candida]